MASLHDLQQKIQGLLDEVEEAQRDLHEASSQRQVSENTYHTQVVELFNLRRDCLDRLIELEQIHQAELRRAKVGELRDPPYFERERKEN